MKKAQTELLGFVMVVAVVSIAILFIVGFLLSRPQTDIRSDFIDKQLAINLNDAVLETSTTCRQIKVRDLLLDCAQEQYLQCNGVRSCDYLENDVFPQLINLTIGEAGRNSSYIYKACIQTPGAPDCYLASGSADAQLFNFSNGDCSRSSTTPGIFPLPTRSGKVVYSVFQICR